jgi:hypothetical protein
MPDPGLGGPKQVVYLFGAGATQAEAAHVGARPINLLMRTNETGEGLSERILKRSGASAKAFLPQDEGVDIEKLISLLGGSGIDRHTDLAEKMRRLYFDELRKRLVEAKIIRTPRLGTALLEMHKNASFRQDVEDLAGVLTTNHDGLLQLAFQKVFGSVNLGFRFASSELDPTMDDLVPPLLQLHGSFTWTFGVPIEVRRLLGRSKYVVDTVWLPPTILKESKAYPFNRLAAVSYGLLVERCDVLRVIGSSLAQNDWNVLSLIFNAQRHREVVSRSAFKVELIMPHKHGLDIQRECSYLSGLTPIGFLTEGQFEGYKADPPAQDPEMRNVFAYWLKEKINYHNRRREFGPQPLKGAMATIAGMGG